MTVMNIIPKYQTKDARTNEIQRKCLELQKQLASAKNKKTGGKR